MRIALTVVIFFFPVAFSFAGDEPKEAAPAPAAETWKAVREPFRIETSLGGWLESPRAAEVVLDPEAWTGYVVVRAAEGGDKARKGDPLVVFETDKIDQEIREATEAVEAARIAVEMAEDELRFAQETKPLDLAAAMRAKERAEEDLKAFLEVDGPLSEKSIRYSVDQARFALEYAAEELRQLEKMYKADDLTEETEEIILVRARREVESARFNIEGTTVRSERSLKVGLPRQKEGLIEEAKRSTIALEKILAAMPKGEAKKRLEMSKVKADAAKAAERLADLKKDREGMTIGAPRDGTVFRGRFVRGRWEKAPTLDEELRPGGSLVPGKKVLMTIVDPRSLAVRADVPEKDIALVRPGVEGTATPPGLGGAKLRVRVEKVSPVPIAPGVFDATLKIDLPHEEVLFPGMECPVKLVASFEAKAIAAPAAAVFDDDAGTGQHVWVLKDGKPERRAVKTGRRAEGKVEILEGLNEGDEILLKKPGKEAPAAGGVRA